MPAGADPADALSSLLRLAENAGATGVATEARALSQRLREGLFYVACLGQFKRGKSTLLNALVGEDVLPVGVVPVTSVVTVLRFGSTRHAVLRLRDGRSQELPVAELRAFVSEEGNPENEKAIEVVEVFVPSPLLASGMCLVDTPGVGSVLANATETTRAFVPHIDAALLVLGADPPISGDELALVKEVARHVQSLAFVVNKVDRLNEAERSEAAAFCQRVLAKALGRPLGPLLQISALGQRTGGFSGDWQRLVDLLENLAGKAGAELVRRAGDRWISLLARRLQADLAEQRAALKRPLEETARRIAELKRVVTIVEQTLGDLGHLFAAEQERIGSQLTRDREAFVSEAVAEATAELHEGILGSRARGTALWREATKLAQRIAGSRLDRWFKAQQPAAGERFRAAARRFVDLANDELARLASTGLPGVEQLPAELGTELGFRVRSRLFYTDLWELSGRSFPAWLTLTFGSRARARAVAEGEASGYLRELLAMNATRVQNDFDERVLESRRVLEAEIRSMLVSAVSSGERALDRARVTQSAGAAAVRDELGKLDGLLLRAAGLAGAQEG
jgi:GTP-binding protein EngB required for normal cell division